MSINTFASCTVRGPFSKSFQLLSISKFTQWTTELQNGLNQTQQLLVLGKCVMNENGRRQRCPWPLGNVSALYEIVYHFLIKLCGKSMSCMPKIGGKKGLYQYEIITKLCLINESMAHVSELIYQREEVLPWTYPVIKERQKWTV